MWKIQIVETDEGQENRNERESFLYQMCRDGIPPPPPLAGRTVMVGKTAIINPLLSTLMISRE
jgi:hypothetical protein